MKTLLVSDTHGDLKAARDILQKYATVDLEVHLEDADFPLREISEYTIVKDNYDRMQRLPKKVKLTLEGHKAICLHGNIFDDEAVQKVLIMHHVLSDEIMDLYMCTLHGKLITYTGRKGHDMLPFRYAHHQCFSEVDGIVLTNPDSVCYETPHSGYAAVEIHGCCIRVQLLAVEDC